MRQTHVLVLGEAGQQRDAFEKVVASLGCSVSAGLPSDPIGGDADILALDARSPAAESADGVVFDHRPLVAVFDGPSALSAQLGRRSAPTLVMAGYSPSGLRVALTTCAALRPSRAGDAQPLAAAS